MGARPTLSELRQAIAQLEALSSLTPAQQQMLRSARFLLAFRTGGLPSRAYFGPTLIAS